MRKLLYLKPRFRFDYTFPILAVNHIDSVLTIVSEFTVIYIRESVWLSWFPNMRSATYQPIWAISNSIHAKQQNGILCLKPMILSK